VVTGLTSNPDGSVTVDGTGLETSSLVYFDGLQGQATAPFSGSSNSGAVSVMPPPGASGQNSTITIYNADGQNSMFTQSQAPFIYSYPQAGSPAATVSTTALPQGVCAMINVTASNMKFVSDLVTVGFGSYDIVVPQVWVLGPTQAWANALVSPVADLTNTSMSVISGFQVYEQPLGFQIQAAKANQPMIESCPVPNALAPLQNSLYPGAYATLYGANLVTSGAAPSITLGGQQVPIIYTSSSQLNFQIPAGTSTGPAILNLNNGSTSAHPIVVQIDPPPPVIASVATSAGVTLNSNLAAAPGSTITLTVTGMDPSVISNPSRVAVTEGVVNIPSFTIQQSSSGSSLQIQFPLAGFVTGTQVPITVSLDGDLSMPFAINIVAPASSSGSSGS
jgi:uncharacterized protein (TIGR03437 family)